MGWFPGYAINLESGERLNIIFSEDSWLSGENGRDMLWNPTSNIVTEQFPFYNSSTGEFSGGSYLLGGKHFIYVVRGESWVKGTEDYINWDFGSNKNGSSPNYDECAWVYEKLNIPPPLDLPAKFEVFENIQLEQRINLYSDYLEQAENIDVDYTITAFMKINDYLSTNLIIQCLYDDNAIKKVQLREVFGLAINLNLLELPTFK